jgi:farnesyl-diphosphate farnesyltransferase
MSGRIDFSARALRGSILRSVSRSFYLSIRILPWRLREPVALAYLLARTTDTVADTAQIPWAVRAQTLQTLSNMIQGKAPREGLDSLAAASSPAGVAHPSRSTPVASIADLVSSFAPLQENAAERTLLESLPHCLEWLEQLNGADQDDVRGVLAKIAQGQTLDLQRFGNPAEVHALATAADLDEYTYLVAGCVGEFWTRLCFRHVRKFARLSAEEMLDHGKRYGMGLQLINILRDAGADLRAGRCYFPNEELATARIDASQILREPERFQPIYRKWLERAKQGVEAGMQYSRAIRHRRIRAATVLPALIGTRTLALLRGAGATMLQRTVKTSRGEVQAMIASMAITFASRSRIDAMFRRLSM